MLVGQGCPIQFCPGRAPVCHHMVHQLTKALIVVSLKQVDHLMNKYVLETDERLLGQLQIQPNPPRGRVAASPASFHSAYPHLSDAYPDSRSPFVKQIRDLLAKLPSIPLL